MDVCSLQASQWCRRTPYSVGAPMKLLSMVSPHMTPYCITALRVYLACENFVLQFLLFLLFYERNRVDFHRNKPLALLLY